MYTVWRQYEGLLVVSPLHAQVAAEEDLEDRVIHDVMDVLGRSQGSYPESFATLS